MTNSTHSTFLNLLQAALVTASCLLAFPIPAKAAEINASIEIRSQCLNFENDIRSSLKTLLQDDSVVFSTLKIFYPKRDLSILAKVPIIIEDFGPQKQYRGFYGLHEGDQKKSLQLDCALGSRLVWSGLLAHEYAHILNEQQNLSSWMDEMLAQLIEINASPFYPYPRTDILKNHAMTPSFFSADKPFKTSEAYASNMLFGVYISQNFRGYRAYQELNHNIQSVDQFAASLKKYTEDQAQFDWIRDHISGENLIIYFNLALNVNRVTKNGSYLYAVPGWNGFSKESLISQSGKYFIEPGGSLRMSAAMVEQSAKADTISKIAPIYRVLKNENEFKIQNPQDDYDASKWTENFLVLINTSLNNYLQVDI